MTYLLIPVSNIKKNIHFIEKRIDSIPYSENKIEILQELLDSYKQISLDEIDLVKLSKIVNTNYKQFLLSSANEATILKKDLPNIIKEYLKELI